jgi:ATP-dependent DNA helicase RecG
VAILHIHPSEEWKVQPNLSPSVKTVEKTVEKILKILSNTPSITVREMSSILGLSRRGVEEQIKSLKQKGVIRRIGPDKGGHWEVIK